MGLANPSLAFFTRGFPLSKTSFLAVRVRAFTKFDRSSNKLSRFFVKSKNLDQALKIKLGGSNQEILVPVGSCYDSESVNWVNPKVEINGSGDIDGEYSY